MAAAALSITPEERRRLNEMLTKRKGAKDEHLRAKIVLACAEGESAASIARRLEISSRTVSKWRGRFESYGIPGLEDAPRSGRPPKITDEQVQEIVDRVRLEKPEDASHWLVFLHNSAGVRAEHGLSAPFRASGRTCG
ncbi:hypothetical protein CCR81_10070 [Halorhodospira halophila]|nr:hypothetical protein [Halorhodospira halophila]